MKSYESDKSNKEYTVRTKAELIELNSFRTLFQTYHRIRLELSGLSDTEQTSMERELNTYYNACGCGEGKFFVFLGFAIFCVQAWQQNTLYFSWKNAGIAFLYCMVGAALGKMFGKFRAYLKMKKKVNSILHRLELTH